MTFSTIRVRAIVALGALALLAGVLAPQTQAPALANGCTAQAPNLAADPVQIQNAGHLLWLTEGPADNRLTLNYVQTAPIDLTGCTFLPIAPYKGNPTTTPAFTGSYDGGGNTITGLTIDLPNESYVGLFGWTDGATIEDIHLVGIDVTGEYYVGGLVGSSESSADIIRDSSVTGTVTGEYEVGGLVGYSRATITRSSSGATVIASDEEAYVGGLVGYQSGGRIVESYATGNVTATDPDGEAVGGIVGYLYEGEVVRSFATGGVTGTLWVGGLVGYQEEGMIVESYATGAVTARASAGEAVGGLVGYQEIGEILRSFATGDVSGVGGTDVGGLVGTIRAGGSIEDSYARGAVVGGTNVGGLVGLLGGPTGSPALLYTSYSTGSVTGTTDVGGLVGEIGNSTGGDNFWDTETSGRSLSAFGTGRTTLQMKSFATFEEDFSIVDGWEEFVPAESPDPVWGICSTLNDGYPFLLWQFNADEVSVACGGTAGQNGGGGTPPAGAPPATPVLIGGVTPLLAPGTAAWQLVDGTTVPLTVSSPGVNQVRYAADGIQVTFTGGAGSDASRGLVANPAGEIVCEVCVQMAAGQVIEAWLFSTPRLVAAHLTQDLPCQTFTIPIASPLDGGGPVSAGAHTLQLALPTASGMQAVNVGVTVGGPVPASVPAGEGPAVPAGLLVLGLLAAGATLTARRQVVAG